MGPWVKAFLLVAVTILTAAGPTHAEERRGAATAGKSHIEEELGTVRRVGQFGYGIVPDADPGTRYAPDRLARRFKVDGLRVIFSGRIKEPPPGVRLWGTPLRLTAIRPAPPRR